MNVKVPVLLVTVGLQFVLCCDETERKGRRQYSLEFLNTEIVREDVTDEYVKWDFFRFGRYNATNWLQVFNGRFQVMKDLPSTAFITVIGHEKMASNKHSQIPVTLIKRKLCEFVEKECLFYYDLRKHSNLPGSCPVVKGNYTIENYRVNEYYLPLEFPGSEWRLFFTIVDKEKKGKVIFKLLIDFHLIPPTSSKPPEP